MVLQLLLQGELTLIADSRILAEYDEVTARRRFGFHPDERRALLDTLEEIAERVVPVPMRLDLPDPDDRVFVEAASAGMADAIVTGNAAHFKAKKGRLRVQVLTPRQLVDRLRR